MKKDEIRVAGSTYSRQKCLHCFSQKTWWEETTWEM